MKKRNLTIAVVILLIALMIWAFMKPRPKEEEQDTSGVGTGAGEFDAPVIRDPVPVVVQVIKERKQSQNQAPVDIISDPSSDNPNDSSGQQIADLIDEGGQMQVDDDGDWFKPV